MDAKADRKQKALIIHNIHFEDVELSKTVIDKFIGALKAFMQFNQCREVVFKTSNHENYLKVIKEGFPGWGSIKQLIKSKEL